MRPQGRIEAEADERLLDHLQNRLILTVRPDAGFEGIVYAEVTVHLRYAAVDQIRVPLRLNIVPAVELVPSVVSFGLIDANTRLTREITLRSQSGERIRIHGIDKPEQSPLTIEYADVISEKHVFQLSGSNLGLHQERGLYESEFTINYALEGDPDRIKQIEVQVSGYLDLNE